jgi:hypothetical protein
VVRALLEGDGIVPSSYETLLRHVREGRQMSSIGFGPHRFPLLASSCPFPE